MTSYKTIAGDTWDIVALKTMGNESHTDKLMKANLSRRETVFFPAGVVLQIPEVEAQAPAGLPPWKGGKK